MKKWHCISFKVCFAALLALTTVFSTTQAAPATSKKPAVKKPVTEKPLAKKPAAKKHFLWKLQSKTATVYLLGSIHVANKAFYPLDKTIYNAFNKADIVGFEISFDMKTMVEMQKKMAIIAHYKAGDSLDKHLPADIKKLLTAYCKKEKVDQKTLNRKKAWMLSIELGMKELAKHGYTDRNGIDLHFFMKALKQRKKVIGLETIDEHLVTFKTLSEKTQMEMLRETLKDLGKTKTEFEKMLKIWKAGDTKALLEVDKKMLNDPKQKELVDGLLYKRNRRMTDNVEKLLKTKSTYFLIVGAAHLVGKKSMVDMLRKANHKVVQQ